MRDGVVIIGDAYVDVTPSAGIAGLSAGHELLSAIEVSAGGSAGYAAQVLAGVKQPVWIYATVGSDIMGTLWMDEVARRGVNIDLVRRISDMPTGLSIVVTMGEDRAFVTEQGANRNRFDGSSIVELDPRLVLISGFLQTPGLWSGEFLHLLASWRLRRASPCVLLDPNLSDCPPEGLSALLKVLPEVDYLLPNRDELRVLGRAEDPQRAARNIHETYGVVVVGKLDRDGAILVEEDRVVFVSAPPVTVLNTNACGDVLAGVFVAGLARGVDTDSAVSLAVQAASEAATVLTLPEKIAAIQTVTRKQLDTRVAAVEVI